MYMSTKDIYPHENTKGFKAEGKNGNNKVTKLKETIYGIILIPHAL